jgi:hypothetical protein
MKCLGREREGVVEGIEGAVRRDRELEAIADTGVLDRHGDRVLVRVPEQQDVDAVAFAGGELPVAGVRSGVGSFEHGVLLVDLPSVL